MAKPHPSKLDPEAKKLYGKLIKTIPEASEIEQEMLCMFCDSVSLYWQLRKQIGDNFLVPYGQGQRANPLLDKMKNFADSARQSFKLLIKKDTTETIEVEDLLGDF